MAAKQESIAATTADRRILVAIDFGTTYSGVAYCLTTKVSDVRYDGNGTLTLFSPKTRSTIIQWPDADGSLEGVTSEKVPTKISYTDTGEVKWGFQVDVNKPHFAEFKLYLNDTQASDSLVAREYPNPNCLRPDDRHTAVKLATDYLRLLREHIMAIFKNKLGEHVTATVPFEYIITVPAIWNEASKSKTLRCAKDAGLRGDIKMVVEPEAASIYVLDSMDPDTIVVGDTFVMCDAGGGTVDLISYTVHETKPLCIQEGAVGDGHKVGSAYLNRIFEKRLKDELRGVRGWGPDTSKEAVDWFEEKVKRSFSGKEDDVLIPVPGLSANKAKGVNARGKYLLSGSALKEIFQPVVPVITTLVQSQIDTTGAAVTSVLMVGGFGQSAYLRESIKEVVGPGVMVVQPPKGWTAVVEGALIKILNERIPDMAGLKITSRKARKCYGLTYTMEFMPEEHDANRK